MNSPAGLQSVYSALSGQYQHSRPILKQIKELPIEFRQETLDNVSDDVLLKQIIDLKQKISLETYPNDPSSNIQIQSVLVEHIQKNQNPRITIEVWMISMDYF